jgi:hypothetical protein
MQRVAGVAQDTAGNALANPSITVKLAGTATVASIFSTATYTALANPFVGAVDGTYQFYAGNGRYDVTIVKGGYTFTAAATTDILLWDAAGFITPAALAANTNDYAPSNGLQARRWRISATAPVNLTGIAAPLFDGTEILLLNVGAQTITVTNADAASLAANRILTGTGASVAMAANQTFLLTYDLTTPTWRKQA